MTCWVCFSLLLRCCCWKTAKTTPTLLAGDLSEFLLWTHSWSIRRQKRAFLVKYSNPPSPSHTSDILSERFVHLPKQITEALHCGWLQLPGLKEHQIKQWHNPHKQRKPKLNLLEQQTTNTQDLLLEHSIFIILTCFSLFSVSKSFFIFGSFPFAILLQQLRHFVGLGRQ